MGSKQQRDRLQTFLDELGVAEVAPSTTPFDPGYDPVTVEAHLAQSGHLMARLKLSMACWMIADGGATQTKIEAARKHGVPTVTGGGPFEIAAAQGRLPEYLDLCCLLGVDRVEAGEGFTDLRPSPEQVLKLASDRGLEVQFELGKKHEGPFQPEHVAELVDESRRWLDAGAHEIIVEARESAADVGLFDQNARLNLGIADQLATGIGLDRVCFEAPIKSSQFALLDHFGPEVRLTNVRLEEVLRVEIYRRGLHSDAFRNPKLRPRAAETEQ